MKTVIIGEWKSNDKLCKNYLFVIIVVITLKQEGSKNYQFSFVLLTFVLSYQVSWVVDARDNLQMQSVLKFALRIKVQIRLPRSKSVAM